MKLILIGCEYAGKTTLAGEISQWMIRERGLASVRWHNHFVKPQLERHLVVSPKGDGGYDVQCQETPDRDPLAMVEHFRAMTPST